jgi:hypothetical protein
VFAVARKADSWRARLVYLCRIFLAHRQQVRVQPGDVQVIEVGLAK